MAQTFFSIPSNVTDAGPYACSRDEPPMDWRDWLDVAQEEARDAQRANHDRLRVQRTLRLASIARAMEALSAAQKILAEQQLPGAEVANGR